VKALKFLIALLMIVTPLAADFEMDPNLINALTNKKIIVIRQSESTNNIQDIVTSSSSPGYHLTPLGRSIIQSQLQEIKGIPLDKVFCSPLYRALQTAEIVGKVFKLTPDQLIPDYHLTMQNFGVFEGYDFDEYKQLFSSQEEMLEGNAAGGELGSLVFERTKSFLYNLSELTETTFLVITHAFNFCHIRMCLTGNYGLLPGPGEMQIFDFTKGF